MNRRHPILWVAAIWCLAVTCSGIALCGAAVQAQEDIYKSIPDDAVGFVLINRLAETSDKLEAVAKQMQIPLPAGPLALLQGQLGVQRGLDVKATAALVFMAGEDQEAMPKPVMLVPVTNYKEFIDQLKPEDAAGGVTKVQIAGSDSLAAKKGNYALLAPTHADDALKSVLNSKKSVAMGVEPLRNWAATNEISFVLTPRGVDRMGGRIAQLLTQASGALGGMDNAQSKNTAKMLDGFKDALKACEGEVTHFAAGLSIKDGNLHLVSRSLFSGSGKFSAASSAVTAPSGGPLAGLPVRPYFMALGGPWPQAWTDGIMHFSTQMMKLNPMFSNLTEEQVEKMKQLSLSSLKGLRGMSMMMGANPGQTSIYSSTIAVMKVDDSKTYMANYQKSLDAMTQLLKGQANSPFQYETKPLLVDGAQGFEIIMDMSGTVKADPNAAAMMEKMFGPGGKLAVYMAAADADTVLLAYVSKENLQKALASYKSNGAGLASDPETKETAALLPSGAQFQGYISVPGAISFVNSIIPTFAPPNAPKVQLPAFAKTPPIGFGAKLSPTGVDTDLVIPSPVVKAIGAYVGEVQRMQPGQAPAGAGL